MNKLKSVRVLKGIKQSDMAEMLGITQTYLSRLESGRVDIKLSMLLKRAYILGVSVGELIEA